MKQLSTKRNVALGNAAGKTVGFQNVENSLQFEWGGSLSVIISNFTVLKKISLLSLITLLFFMHSEKVFGQGHWNGNNNTVDDIDRPGNVAIGLPGGTAPLRPLHLNGFFLFENPTNFAIETGFGNLFMHNGGNTMNTFTGFNAASGSTGQRLTHSGYRAGFGDRGQWNTFTGYESGLGNSLGSYNSFFGAWAGLNNSDGELNTFIGAEAGRDNENGFSNTYIGFRAGLSSSDSYENIALGNSALQNNTTGIRNIAIGYNSFLSPTSESNNISIGYRTGESLNLSENMTLVGNEILMNGFNATNNTIMGYRAAANGISVHENVILGNTAVENCPNLEHSVIIGTEIARNANNTGQSTIIGSRAGLNWDSGSNNIVMGFESARDLTTGNSNVIIGQEGGLNITNDFGSVMLGNNTEKFGSNAVGHITLVGTEARVNATGSTIDNSSAIGYNSEVCDDHTMVLGDHSSATQTTVVIGDCQRQMGGAPFFLEVNGRTANGPGGPWDGLSDRRAKKEIENFDLGLTTLKEIKPVTYKYDVTKVPHLKALEGETYVGIIAQEMLEIESLAEYTIGQPDKNGFHTYNSNALLYLQINSIKEQQNQIDSLSAVIAEVTITNEEEDSYSVDSYSNPDDGRKQLTGELEQNKPNPFSEETIVSYRIEGQYKNGNITILDFEGRHVHDFRVNEQVGEIRFNGSGYKPGIYFYGLFVDGEMLDIRKMIIAR